MNWLLGLPLGLLKLLGTAVLVILRIAWPVLLGLGAAALVRRSRRRKDAGEAGRAERPDKAPDFRGPVYTVDYEEVPEEPVPFGYQLSWLAVRSTDPEAVLQALGGRPLRAADWNAGVAAAYAGERFLSPCLNGFVLVLGGAEEEQARRLAASFGTVEYFATHRVTEYHAWARYDGGRCARSYAYDGERGEVLRDQGPLTMEEIALGFGALPRQGGAAYERPPTEEDVLDIAAAWGPDPRRPGGGDVPGGGRIFR